jgi:hypothetical protein
MKSLIAALVVAIALPATALGSVSDLRLQQQVPGSSLGAVPPDQRGGAQSDLRAPDQREQPALSLSRPLGTDVAASDQQAPLNGPRVIVAPASSRGTDSTDWSDAGLGAIAALAAAGLMFGAAMTLRRRTTRGPSPLAG